MKMDTIYGNLSRIIEQCGTLTAVIDGTCSMTYAELNRWVDEIRGCFPIERPQFVGVVMDHGIDMIATILAVIKSGAGYVAAEPSLPEERIRFMMSDAGVDFVIADKRYAGMTGGVPVITSDMFENAEDKSPLPSAEISSDNPAYVLYTSGTTGRPKGVVVTNGNVCHYVKAFQHEFHPAPGDVMLQYSVCSFDIFVEEVFTTLLSGATLLIAPESVKNDVAELMSFVVRQGVTIISGFPYLLLEINKLGTVPPSLRLLISGGDVLRSSYVDRIIDKVDIYNTYGPSETTVCASYFRCNDYEQLLDGTYPVGKPVLGVEVTIVDEFMEPLPAGEVGELCISGGGVSLGYLHRCPESDNFVTLEDGRRLYRSGDLGYVLADGNIAFLHRKDSQVMIMGKRVECSEVENVLCKCDDVESGVVCSYLDTNGLSYLAAYIVPKDRRRFSIHGLKKRLERYLTSFMIPEYFVAMKEIPLTPNGKPDKEALPVVLKDSEL